MGKKIFINVNGKSLSLSEWARELGVTRQRIYKLYQKGKLEEYIKNGPQPTGRPFIVNEKLDPNKSVKELAEEYGVTEWTIYMHRKKSCGK